MRMNKIKIATAAIAFGVLAAFPGCRRDISDFEQAKFSDNPNVFIDDFSAGLQYAAFGGSDVRSFDVERVNTYNNSAAAMKFQIPDANDPNGAFAGGVFYVNTGRDLSGYDALTFWAKASQSASIDVIGFGDDLGESKFRTSIFALNVNTNWKKYYIPLPDAARLTQEKGLLYLAEGPENDRGYTLYIDEVKFEKLGTLSDLTPKIFNGENRTTTAETGEKLQVTDASFSANLPNGVDQQVAAAPAYFTYSSSNTAVAEVSPTGEITVKDAGNAVITGKIGDKDAEGSLAITSTGAPKLPPTPAPVPSQDAADVISMYSNKYTNRPVDTWNTRWQFSNAEESFLKIANDDVIRYRKLNFVGISFASNTIDASAMTNFRMDIWTPDATNPPKAFKILLVDFGPNNQFGGGDDSQHEVTITSPTLKTEQWVSIDIPFSAFTGLTSRKNLAQLVLSGDLPNIFLDNVYYYKKPTPPSFPTVAAPVPTRSAANVQSVFSNTYGNLAGTDFNPNWGQQTVTSIVPIAGNDTYKMLNLNYQGIQLGSAQNVSSMNGLHMDVWTNTSTSLKVFLISPGPVETPVTVTVPTSGWASIDIPLSQFSPVNLGEVIQFKFEGNGEIYIDNIYFFKNPVIPPVPAVAAPTPTVPAANVLSVFSDAYTNVAGTDFNPNWGQATATTQVPIAGNNTYKMAGLNYQGIQLGAAQNVSTYTALHLDFYSANSTEFKVFLISAGPKETPVALTVPTAGGWTSIDIPLTSFSSVVNLAEIIQFKFEGNGDVYVDNIYFRK